MSGVTITGGVSHGSPQGGCGPDIPECGRGYPRATALAGGVEVLPKTTALIADSVVTRNQAVPTTMVPSVRAVCPAGPCPFAQAAAGGIDNWGTLTLERTTVSDNEAGGPLTAQADGGGIVNELRSSLTLIDSTVTRNRAVADPGGRFASGGGIYVDRFGTVLVQRSVISANRASLVSSFPKSVGEMNSNSAGIFVGNGGTITIEGSSLSGNVVTVTDLKGEPVGFDPGMCVCGPRTTLVMRNSKVTGNRMSVTVGNSTAVTGGSGGVLEAGGDVTINGVRVTDNRIVVNSPDGVALAVAVVNLYDGGAKPATLTDTVIAGNSVTATSARGSARVMGAGLANNRPAVLTNVQVARNRARATAPTGWVRGAGIFNGKVFFRPTPDLTLHRSSITGNSITATAGIEAHGAGVYTKSYRVTRDATVVAKNTPDQCFGC
jgi:hypothetical protein